mmetsp:Transcript_75590/g.180596  ORF Transcript_75590/g.180596 Transcript_75590/m.180596 type:complete len:303 (-) Transcript_75590:68-976(-)
MPGWCLWMTSQATLPASLAVLQCFHELCLPAHLEDLLQEEEDEEDVAHRILLQVLPQLGHQPLHLWGCQAADGQADAHDHSTNGGAADELDGLEEVGEGLLTLRRLQAVAPQLIPGSRQHASCDDRGEHVDYAAHRRVRERRVQRDQEGRDLVACDAIDDVPKNRWRVCLVEVGRRHWHVHRLSEAIVCDGQSDRAEDRSQRSSPGSWGKVHALHDDVGGLKKGELDEVGGKRSVQIFPDVVRIQLLDGLTERRSVHQHVVHQRLCHRTQRSRHHCPHRALRRGADHAAHEILLRHGAQNEG